MCKNAIWNSVENKSPTSWTLFQQKIATKQTWYTLEKQPLTVYILMWKRDPKDIYHTKVMPSAECHTDHHLVYCKFNCQFKPNPKKGSAPTRVWVLFNGISTSVGHLMPEGLNWFCFLCMFYVLGCEFWLCFIID